MADSNTMSESRSRKRREVESDVPGVKRIKLEDDMAPVANPNTIEAVREKNRKMALDLIEKNRRISFLTQKCESLFQRRAITESGFRCIQRQWLQLLDDLHALVPEPETTDKTDDTWWDTIIQQTESLGILHVAPEAVQLQLPEWFLAIVRKDQEVILPAETSSSENSTVLSSLLTSEEETMKTTLIEQQKNVQDLMRRICTRSHPETETKKLLMEKRQASASAFTLKEELALYKQKMIELQADLEYKELERHRVCREYDRLCEYMERTNQTVKATDNSEITKVVDDNKKSVQSSPKKNDVKQETENIIKNDAEIKRLRADLAIFNSKLQTERRNFDTLRKEVDRLRASEAAWKNEEAQLKQEHDATMTRLNEKLSHTVNELEEMRNNVKGIEEQVHSSWKERLSSLQDEYIKIKKHTDDVVVKNAALREKMATYSGYRDQLSDLKAGLESSKREAANWKKKCERQESKEALMKSIAEKEEIVSLNKKITLLTTQNTELKQMIAALESGNISSELMEFRVKYEQLQSQYTNVNTSLQQLQLQLEEHQSNEDAYKNENDAFISEIETLTKEIETARHSKKKVLHQLEEKRSSMKKLHSALAKEVDAKAHCIEELAAARLQVSSLNDVHQQQKATLDAQKAVLQAKEAEVDALKQCIQKLEGEREVITNEKQKTQREVDVFKQMHQFEQEQEKRGCEQCETYRQKEIEYERQLATAKTNGVTTSGPTGALSDLERFELQDLQKQLKCSVCQDRHKEVVISKCFHMFCKECVDSNLRSRNRKCPTCKKMFGQDDVRSVWFT